MIKATNGYLGTNMTIPPELITRVFFNSPFGAFSRVGPPTLKELIERREHLHKIGKALNAPFFMFRTR